MNAAMMAVIALSTIAAIAICFYALAILRCSRAIDSAEAELDRLRSSSLNASQVSTSSLIREPGLPSCPSASKRRTDSSPMDSKRSIS